MELPAPLLKTLNALPYFVRISPYVGSFWGVLLWARPRHALVWTRNSVRLNYFYAGLSDIDFTFFYQYPPAPTEIRWLKRRYNQIKRLFPMIGEFNLYVESEASPLLLFANPLELDRDPLLAAKMGSRPTTTPEKNTTFFLRMFDADAKNLARRFSFRLPKWRYHLVQCGLNPEHLTSIGALLETLERSFFSPLAIDGAPELLRSLLSQVSYDEIVQIPKLRRLFLALYPHRWLSPALGSRLKEDFFAEAKDLSLGERKILLEQIGWEIWGLNSQYRMIDDSRSIDSHLHHLRRLVDLVDGPDLRARATALRDGLLRLAEHTATWS